MAAKKRREQNIAQSKTGMITSFAISFFLAGAILRVLLCWWNPPDNAFDNHFEPILMMIDSGSIPAKNACWQCYHPPVFYALSAIAGKLLMVFGLQISQVIKPLQFANCLYGILHMAVIYLILKRLPLTAFSRLFAFGVVCFLPRHIYMSAMNSNDTISYLFIAISVYLLILTVERKFATSFVLATSIAVSITLFTKYTAYAVLPAIIAPFVFLYFKKSAIPRKKVVASCILLLFLPLALLTTYFASNYKNYGSPLPWNLQQRDPSLTQPHDKSKLDFFSFNPLDGITMPIIAPGRMHSFWTLVYDGMWFDNEPRFLFFMDSNLGWWKQYYLWLRGEAKFPGDNNSMSYFTRLTGAGLIALGLLPLFLLIKGSYHYVKRFRDQWRQKESLETAKMSIFPALLIGNAAIVIALALRLEVYSATKASYFLGSLPVFAIFFSYGLASYEKSKKIKVTFAFFLCLLFAFAGLHILQICRALAHQA